MRGPLAGLRAPDDIALLRVRGRAVPDVTPTEPSAIRETSMLAMLMMISAQAGAEPPAPMIPTFFTGEALYEICRRPNAGQCSMYVAGVLDGLFYARSRDGEPLCPAPMTNREAADLVVRYLAANAGVRRHAASVGVREALADRLECGAGRRRIASTD